MVRSVGAVLSVALLSGCSVTVAAKAPSYALIEEAPSVDIPPGHMPPPGECRTWFPGEPPGRQPPSGNCDDLLDAAPPGAWVLYRPDAQRRVVRID
jgi:hypothetical protein